MCSVVLAKSVSASEVKQFTRNSIIRICDFFEIVKVRYKRDDHKRTEGTNTQYKSACILDIFTSTINKIYEVRP